MCGQKVRFGASGAVLLAILLAAPVARAASAGASLSVSATIVGSIAITVLSDAETHVMAADTITVPVRIGIDGAPPPGFSVRRDATQSSYVAAVNIRVFHANIASSEFAMIAHLNSAPQAGTRWSINGHVLSEATEMLSANGFFGNDEAFTFRIDAANSAISSGVENTFVVTLVAN